MAMVGRVGDRGNAGEGHRDDRGDIFPALGRSSSPEWCWVVWRGTSSPACWGETVTRSAMGTFGAALGTIMGSFVGLSLGVWRVGLPSPAPGPEREPVDQTATARQLWDPWLDSGRDAEWVASEGQPEPAASRSRRPSWSEPRI